MTERAKIAAQAVEITKLRECFQVIKEYNLHYGLPLAVINLYKEALAIPTDSTQILQEWFDSVLGEPASYEFQDTGGKWRPFLDQRHFDNTKKDGRWPIRGLYIKLEKL